MEYFLAVYGLFSERLIAGEISHEAEMVILAEGFLDQSCASEAQAFQFSQVVVFTCERRRDYTWP